ncbi:hypothetical protein TREPR_1158 [Treponema primitia ZAS-2]|uniref:Uncharacterized protein n=1 Tax=Treponema primitia (strain ATCC BAA-887 / DSM 12427 / ZAS-2) TaxID=545694 RepID=F5YGW9_TREPZ|nr:hypothetical protein [Treponema primitia]AEF86951.1 hypothetical protein TREPR_1158 [Treponema primitia ZAS-2]
MPFGGGTVPGNARREGYKQAKEEDAGIIQEKDREIAELRAKLDRP